MSFDQRTCPVFINVRDRVTDLRLLVAWLEAAGHERIILLDNHSSYPELLDFLAETPHEVVRLGENLGSHAIWLSGLVPVADYWVLSDPDVVPIEACPPDAVQWLYELLGRYPAHAKAGLGLYLDDVPADMPYLGWERGLVSPERMLNTNPNEVAVFDSLVDTSFALYRPRTLHSLRALRTGWPYQARHMTWYHDSQPTDEELYYLQRARRGPLGSSWAERFQTPAP